MTGRKRRGLQGNLSTAVIWETVNMLRRLDAVRSQRNLELIAKYKQLKKRPLKFWNVSIFFTSADFFPPHYCCSLQLLCPLSGFRVPDHFRGVCELHQGAFTIPSQFSEAGETLATEGLEHIPKISTAGTHLFHLHCLLSSVAHAVCWSAVHGVDGGLVVSQENGSHCCVLH